MKANILTYAKAAMFFMFGVAAIVFALGTVVNNPVKADNPSTVNSTGKIQMAVDGFALNGKAAFHIIVWDSETGKSKTYIFDGVNRFVSAAYQLPSSPLY